MSDRRYTEEEIRARVGPWLRERGHVPSWDSVNAPTAEELRERLRRVAQAARLHAENWPAIRLALAPPPRGHGRGDRIMEGRVIRLDSFRGARID
jgi:hypothetical protein